MVNLAPFDPTANQPGNLNAPAVVNSNSPLADLPPTFNPLRELIPNFNPPPIQTSLLSNILGPSPTGDVPLAPNLPNAIKAYNTKYTELGPMLDKLPSSVTQALATFDAARVKKGQSPIGPDQTASIVKTLLSGQPATKNTEARADLPAIPGNVLSDLEHIVTSLPHLPIDLLHTATQLPQVPHLLSQAMATPGGIGKQLQAVTQVPGINLIPGSYTLGSILGGESKQLIQHPLFAALDVLPALHDLGIPEAIMGSRLGEPLTAANQYLRDTHLGQIGQQMFGRDSRLAAIAEGRGVARMITAATPDMLSRLMPGSIDAMTNEIYDFARPYQDAFTDERKAQLVDIATTHSFKDLADAGLSDKELGYVDQYRTLVDRLKTYVPDELVRDGEVYNTRQITRLNRFDKKIGNLQDQLDRVHLFTRLNTITNMPQFMNVAPDTVRSLMDDLKENYLDPLLAKPAKKVSADVKREAIRGYVSAYTQHGFDADAETARATLRGSINTARDYLDTWKPDFIGEPPKPGSWPDIQAQKFMERNADYTIPKRDAFRDVINERIQKWEDRKSQVLPARFEPMVEKYRNARIVNQLADLHLPADQAGLVMDRAANRQYRLLREDGFITDDEFKAYTKDAIKSVADMKESGFDPTFLHKVAPDRTTLVNAPRPFLRDVTPTSLRERTYDISPYVKDFNVALTHQAMELLGRDTTREVLTRMFDTDPETRLFARRRVELDRQYEAAARARADLNPRLDVEAWINKMRNREWTHITPQHLPEALREDTKGLLGEDVYVPKPVWKNMQRLMTPISPMKGALELPLRIFRTSVLGLSPRFALNSTLGALIEMTGGTDAGAFKYFNEARDLLKYGDTELHPEGLPDSFRATMGSTTRAAEALPPIADFKIRSGSQLGRIWNQIQDSKIARAAQTGLEKSFDLTGWTHDVTRVMTYLYGEAKALEREGMTVEEARAAGEALARRTIQTLDDLTPLERSIMRSVFPFYGYMRHVLQYAGHYTLDHPFRVSVLAALARMEQRDWNSGLPEMFQGSFFIGKPSVTGDQKVLTLNGLNPWRDLADMFTLAGFTSQVNPLVGGALQAMGVDTRSASADLYPGVVYNPDTGLLEAKHGSMIGNIMRNLVPQQNVVAALIGASSPLRDLMNTNPVAGQRMFASGLGVPLLFRDINIPQYEIKTELAREQVQQSALSDALRTGDYSNALRYPGLRPILAQVRTLHASGDLAQYEVNQVNSPNMLAFAQQSLRAALTGTGG